MTHTPIVNLSSLFVSENSAAAHGTNMYVDMCECVQNPDANWEVVLGMCVL